MLNVIDNILNGYNSTLFAYGMTGAGKTHTLFGELHVESMTRDNSGLIWLSISELFNQIAASDQSECEFGIKFSYLEIYNEQVRDLLKPNSGSSLMIVEDPAKGIFVAELTEHHVSSPKDVLYLITTGNSRRTMAATGANQFSSRSHAIIQVTVERKSRKKDFTQTIVQSKLSLIDLAGSERAAATENRGIRMQEGANINRSLLSLGNCINILSDPTKKGAFVPYRDSKLTRLLKDSLGGNTKTVMISCISPSFACYEETINTLKYASRAKNIERKIEKNVQEVELHVSQYKEIISNLKSEIENLKMQLRGKEQIQRPMTPDIHSEHEEGARPKSSEGRYSFGTRSVCGNPHQDGGIEQTSNQIFEKLEQHWEINQTLKELKDLEAQNKRNLEELNKHLSQLLADNNSDHQEKIGTLKAHIQELKQIMENNQKIKEEVESSLRSNLEESKKLNGKIAECASTLNNHEEMQLVKKLMQIEKMGIHEQNAEIKKEALQLAKEKMAKNKQISQMEEELRLMRQQLEEKDKTIASNNLIISNLVQSQHGASINSFSNSTQSPKRRGSTYHLTGAPLDSLQKSSIDVQSFAKRALQASISTDDSKKQKPETHSDFLKKILVNLEERIDKSLNQIDEKIHPASSTAERSHSNTRGSIRNLHVESQPNPSKPDGPLSVLVKPSERMDSGVRTSVRSINSGLTPLHVESPNCDPVSVSSTPATYVRSGNMQQRSDNGMSLHLDSHPRNVSQHTPNSLVEISEIHKEDGQELLESASVHDFLTEFNQHPLTGRDELNLAQRVNIQGTLGIREEYNPHSLPNSKGYHRSSERSLGAQAESSERRNQQQPPKKPFPFQSLALQRMLNKEASNESFHKSKSQNTQESAPEQVFQQPEGTPVCSTEPNSYSHRDGPKGQEEAALSNSQYSSMRQSRQSDIFAQRKQNSNMTHCPDQLPRNLPKEQPAEPLSTASTKQQSNRGNSFRSQTPEISSFNKSQDLQTLHEKKPAVELRALDEARETLKIFRNRLNILANIDFRLEGLTEEYQAQISNLLEEYRVKKYIISIKDSENLAKLREIITNPAPYIKHLPDRPQSRGKASGVPAKKPNPSNRDVHNSSRNISTSHGDARSLSVSNVNKQYAGAEKRGVTPTSKQTAATPHRGMEMLKAAVNAKAIQQKPGTVMAKGGFSAINTNYAKALNKAIGMHAKPDAKSKTPVRKDGSINDTRQINGKKINFDDENFR